LDRRRNVNGRVINTPTKNALKRLIKIGTSARVVKPKEISVEFWAFSPAKVTTKPSRMTTKNSFQGIAIS